MYVFSNAQGQCEYYQWSGKAYWHISGLAKHTGISVVWQSILVVTQRHCVNGLLPGHQLVGIQSTGQ